ncbi:unnamed protein product [Phytophthora lilii]|uniref:Unnamed protein product n=1 Tax=Phytophthora lilii TaxID=2077276 RepID=A0A9W6UDF8_9STRA|nr:unnamed protein product [Phytophthora lilii]
MVSTSSWIPCKLRLVATYDGLDNVPIDTLSPAYAGVTYPVARNSGYKERAQFLNTSTTATTSATAILGTNTHAMAKGSVQHAGSASATLTAGQDVFVAFYLATVRLKDLSDCIAKLPLIKNLKGFIYVN